MILLIFILLSNLLFSENLIYLKQDEILKREFTRIERDELEKFFSLKDGVFMKKGEDKNNFWNIEKMYSSLDEWYKTFDKVNKKEWQSINQYKGQLKYSENNILKTLKNYFETYKILEKLCVYSQLLLDQDISNSKSKEAYGLITSVLFDFKKETAWIEPELLQMDEGKLLKYSKDPFLKDYSFYLERVIKLKPYTLSEKEEMLIAKVSETFQTPYKTFSSFNNADLVFGEIEDSFGKKYKLTHGKYLLFLRSNDRTLRKEAFEKLHGKFLDFENTLCELVQGKIKDHVFLSQSKGYEDCLHASLYPNDISKDVYYNLINTVKENSYVLRKFVDLKKKILNLSKIHPYDLYANAAKGEDIIFDIEEAKEKVIDSVEILGEEYQQILRKGLKEDRWVDFYEKDKKRSGAYSSGCYDSFPYILMNYHGNLNDIFTLAHEAGHSMHSYLSNKYQSYQNSFYPIFLGEIASTFNEQLLFDFLFENLKDKNERNMLLLYKIDAIHATFFRQVLFAEFELKIHNLLEKNRPLTPQLLKDIYTKLYSEYYGEDLYLDKYISIEWARVPHFYCNFYVYQYATGISAAMALHDLIKKDKTNCKKYLNFLKSGGSCYPLDLLKEAGVDLKTPEPIISLITYFNGLVDLALKEIND